MLDLAPRSGEAGGCQASGAHRATHNQQHGNWKQRNEYVQGKQHLLMIAPAKISSFQSRTEKQTFVGWLL